MNVWGEGFVAAAPSITTLLRPLGTQSVRTSRLMRFSNAYVMHPPTLPGPNRMKEESNVVTEMQQGLSLNPDSPMVSTSQSPASQTQTLKQDTFPTPRPFLVSTQTPKRASQSHPTLSTPLSTKQYLKTQKQSPIAHLPFTGPYAIDSFRIFSSDLPGGGAPAGVEAQLKRIAHLPIADEGDDIGIGEDDFDETPSWYDPALLRVGGDEGGDEWRMVRPNDKELKRYLVSSHFSLCISRLLMRTVIKVWRWAIEGLAYNPETQFFEPASWTYLVNLIRQ